MTPIQELIEQLEFSKRNCELHSPAYTAFSVAIEYAELQCKKEKVNKLFMSAEELAEWFHDNYEEVSLEQGWKTQTDCQVPFADLPESNKRTMIEVCQRFINL